jgi:hypothetical protein
MSSSIPLTFMDVGKLGMDFRTFTRATMYLNPNHRTQYV